MNEVISIIIPIYNSEKSLKTCIESVLSQTYKDLEVILIDDGSKDNSLSICRKYERKDKRVKVIHQKNAGPSIARNNAIKVATGKYIQFFDSDDFIDKNMCLFLYNAISNNYELAICSYNELRYDGIRKSRTAHERSYSRFQYIWELKSDPMSYYHGVLWNKIYLRSIIIDNKIFFEKDINLGEDFVFNMEYLKYVKNVRSLKKYLYNYVCFLPESLSKAEKALTERISERTRLFECYRDFWKYIKLDKIFKWIIDSYIIVFYLSELSRTQNADIYLEYNERKKYSEYIYEKCIIDFNVSNLTIKAFKLYKVIKQILYSIKNYKVRGYIFEAYRKMVTKFFSIIRYNKKVLLYCDSIEMEEHIIDYYESIKEVENVKVYLYYEQKKYNEVEVEEGISRICKNRNITSIVSKGKVNYLPWHLVVCANLNLPEKLDKRTVPIMCINHGLHEVSSNKGIRPYAYQYFLNKSQDSNCDFNVILEPNKRYSKIIDHRYEEFLGVPKAVGYKWTDKILDSLNNYNKFREDLSLEKDEIFIVICGTWNADGIFHTVANEIIDKIKKINNKKYKVAISIHKDEYDESNADYTSIIEYCNKKKEEGVIVREISQSYIPYIIAANLVISDYSSMQQIALLARKPIIITEYSEERVWKHSINAELRQKAIIYNEYDNIEELFSKAINSRELEGLYNKCYAEIGVSAFDYKKKVISITEDLLYPERKNLDITKNVLYQRRIKEGRRINIGG